MDYVTLPDYQGLPIPADVQAVSDEDLQKQIDALLQEFTETREVTDRAVKDGDAVNIDYVGSVDGVEFQGGSTGGNGTTVTIGVTNYIDDFLEQLIRSYARGDGQCGGHLSGKLRPGESQRQGRGVRHRDPLHQRAGDAGADRRLCAGKAGGTKRLEHGGGDEGWGCAASCKDPRRTPICGRR